MLPMKNDFNNSTMRRL